MYLMLYSFVPLNCTCRVTQLLRDLFVHMHHYLDLDLELDILIYSIEFLNWQ